VKAAIKKHEQFNHAVKIDALQSNFFFEQPFGRRINDMRYIDNWKKEAKKAYVGAKGKATLAAVKRWIRENKPTEFFAHWRADCATWKDDVVEIYYK